MDTVLHSKLQLHTTVVGEDALSLNFSPLKWVDNAAHFDPSTLSRTTEDLSPQTLTTRIGFSYLFTRFLSSLILLSYVAVMAGRQQLVFVWTTI